MRIVFVFATVGLLLLGCFAAADEPQPRYRYEPTHPLAIPEGERKGYVAYRNQGPVKNPVYPMTYRIEDFPLWSKNGKDFDPSLLIALIKATVEPETWNHVSTIAPKRSSLVIATTNDNHAALAGLLKKLRAGMMTQSK